ncbi:MAG: formate/nitrite transporter family protein [Alphaproteobacteria bacterium]|nr:formate/nitrite transporter family protein [Alphaproteobacteria bacterium]
MAEDINPSLSEAELEDIEERSAPAAKIVHAAVSKQGEDELARPAGSLFWSGTAAGIAIISSVVAQAAIGRGMPEAPWKEAVTAFGYALGFMIVILGRMQLFTEQTMVAVLPFAKSPSLSCLGRVARLWSIVLVGNMVGAAGVAALVVFGRTQSPDMLSAMLRISAKLLDRSALDTFLQAIPAGFLIASIAWIRSAAVDVSFSIVLVLTYTIAAGGFAHVVAGASEAFLLLWAGKAGLAWVLGGFILPALAGNIVGGTGLFAMLAHAQVKDEI